MEQAVTQAAFALVERVARLNPDAGEIGAGMLASLVGDARAILNQHTPRDALRESHAELQGIVSWLARETETTLSQRMQATMRRAREVNPQE